MEKHMQLMHHAASYIDSIILATSNARCRFAVMDESYISGFRFPDLVRDNNGNRLIPGDYYMIVTCANGYTYHINVSGDSVVTACAETFDFLQCKI